jgi:hypothetical protein
LAICTTAKNQIRPGTAWEQDEYDALVEAYAFLAELVTAEIFKTEVFAPELNAQITHDCKEIFEYIDRVLAECKTRENQRLVESTRNRFRLSLGTAFAYEFTQGDLDRVQALFNELRDLVAAADYFEDEHKHRLLMRLERLQRELHKRVSDLDRFWGFFSDAGIAMGKFGTDAKPFFDRVREVTQIVWRTQARAEELPSDSHPPSLENKPSEPPAIEA